MENEYAWVDIFCVQECNSYHVELRPIFYEPISTDETISFGRNAGGIRGVATYAKEGENFNINNDKTNINHNINKGLKSLYYILPRE